MHRTQRRDRAAHRRYQGFTLIELLVVVAIIALLISILLPSLGKAREQARAALCNSRLSQLTKAMLIYADDYNETLPFILKGCGSDPNWHDKPNDNSGANRRKETWLADGNTMQWIYEKEETRWYETGLPKVLHSGTLFSYARFPGLYLCPEFEKETNGLKDQNVFNYTRNILGRKAIVGYNPTQDIALYDNILKMSSVFSSSSLPLLFDESWSCYVGMAVDKNWVWGGHDPMLDLWNSCLGQYHGAAIRGWAWYDDDPAAASYTNNVMPNVPLKSASVSYYDGHVNVVRDPVPNVTHTSGGRPPTALGLLGGSLPYDPTYGDWIENMLYAQQGKTLRQWAGMAGF